MKTEHSPNDNEKEKNQRQIQIIQNLATRLPWIVVLVTLLAAILTIIQVIWSH